MPFPGEMSPNVERTKRDRRRSRPRDCTGPLPLRRPRTAGAPCWTTRIFSGAQPFIRRKQLSRSLRHHDHALRLLAQRGEHVALVIRRLREHRVKRQDERSRELLGERQHVLAVGTAEDPVLVLQQDDVDVESTQQPCRSDVIAPHRLRHGREDVVPLRARRLVDDRDCTHALHARNRQQRRPDVERERSDPARARRVRREDRSTHGARAPLSAGVRRAGAKPPEAWPGRTHRSRPHRGPSAAVAHLTAGPETPADPSAGARA